MHLFRCKQLHEKCVLYIFSKSFDFRLFLVSYQTILDYMNSINIFV